MVVHCANTHVMSAGFICFVLLTLFVSESLHDIRASPFFTHQYNLALKPRDFSFLNERELSVQLGGIKSLLTDVKTLKYLQQQNSSCLHSLLTMAWDLKGKEMYALQMLDAWGKPESGLLNGNIHWEGRYFECINSQKVINKTTIFGGKYCMLESATTANTPSAFGYEAGITFALCIPDSCSQDNLTNTINSIVAMLKNNLSFVVKCYEKAHKWSVGDSIAVTVIVLFLTLTALGTFLPLLWRLLPDSSITVATNNDEDEALIEIEEKAPSSPMWLKLLQCFSLVRNSSLILDTNKKEGNIHCLHGLRVLSILWIILGHTFLFVFPVSDNLKTFVEFVSANWTFMFILNGMYAVDTFFFISGLLVTFLGMRQMTKTNGSINVPLMYLSRYLRLTPAYAFVILYAVSLYKYAGDGPNFLSVGELFTTTCSDQWWSNLLYISNLYPIGFVNECIAWSWYLANDMQFYILAPVFLILLFRRNRVGVFALVTSIFVSMAITCALSAYYGVQPWDLMFVPFVSGVKGKPVIPPYVPTGNATASDADKVASDLYTKPWIRISVYLIGMLAGYCLHKNERPQLNKWLVMVGWLCCTITMLGLMYGNFKYIHNADFMSLTLATFYNTIGKPLWGLALFWIVVACYHGYGGVVNSVLSARFWIPMSRLTYSTYLVHPLILMTFFTVSEVKIHFSLTLLICYYLATVVLAFGVSFLITMIIEMPFTAILQIIRQPK